MYPIVIRCRCWLKPATPSPPTDLRGICPLLPFFPPSRSPRARFTLRTGVCGDRGGGHLTTAAAVRAAVSDSARWQGVRATSRAARNVGIPQRQRQPVVARRPGAHGPPLRRHQVHGVLRFVGVLRKPLLTSRQLGRGPLLSSRQLGRGRSKKKGSKDPDPRHRPRFSRHRLLGERCGSGRA